jgi:hypothetical protein
VVLNPPGSKTEVSFRDSGVGGAIGAVMTSRVRHHQHHQRALRGDLHRTRLRSIRPAEAHRQRGTNQRSAAFSAPETWHEPQGSTGIRFVYQSPGPGYVHPVTIEEVRQRIAELPAQFTRTIQVVQFSAMTRKRSLFPLYGMQWGPSIYLYPIEESLQEIYHSPPTPQQQIEARMFGVVWRQIDRVWTLTWTPESIRDFYLNNVLAHEIGHVNDLRNTNSAARERYANWFATEYGYRASRGRV